MRSAGETEDAPVKVFIVDDHPVMRQGIAQLLSRAGMETVGDAATVAEALAGVARTAPDVVLVDLTLGDESGLTLLEGLVEAGGKNRRLVYSMNEDALSVERALAAGADGYVTKGEVWEALVVAAQTVAKGKRYLSSRACRALDHALCSGQAIPAELSAREREVFALLGAGYATAEIGERLSVSPRTVESYYSRLLGKLRLAGMRELRRAAIAANRRGPA